MPNHRERSYGERPGDLRSEPEGSTVTVSRSQGSHGVLLEEAPQTEYETLQSRPEWQLACRVAGSKGFCKSEFLPRFLLYVCEQYLMGETQEITEQRIGTQIFNRSTDYNPGEDNIVRSYARLLRKRLDEYFEGEGREEPLRIVVLRGGYIPAFPRNVDAKETSLEVDPQEGNDKNGLP